MATPIVLFPFDLFGSSGTAAGVLLLGDAIQEMIEDAEAEDRPCRSHAYAKHLKLDEVAFQTLDELQAWRKIGRQKAKTLLKGNDPFFWLTGNHLGLLPVYEELGSDTLVLQLDAHLDVYNLHDCLETLSHGNFLMYAQEPLPTIVNLGHRDLFLPKDQIDPYFQNHFSASQIHIDADTVWKQLQSICKKKKRIFVDIDCDVFDPVFFPATPGQQPFGLAPAFVLQLLNRIPKDRFCGIAFSEFDPGRDHQDRSLSTLIWLIEWILLRQYES